MTCTSSRITKEMRSSQRFPTGFNAEILWHGMSIPVEVANISAGGAMIKGAMFLGVGTLVTLKARALSILAEVSWKARGGMGLRFKGAVNPLEIVRQNFAGLEHFRSSRALAVARRTRQHND